MLFFMTYVCTYFYSTYDNIKVKENVTNSNVTVPNAVVVVKVISKCSSLRRVQNVV